MSPYSIFGDRVLSSRTEGGWWNDSICDQEEERAADQQNQAELGRMLMMRMP